MMKTGLQKNSVTKKPCQRCGTEKNVVFFIYFDLWLCRSCFIKSDNEELKILQKKEN